MITLIYWVTRNMYYMVNIVIIVQVQLIYCIIQVSIINSLFGIYNLLIKQTINFSPEMFL